MFKRLFILVIVSLLVLRCSNKLNILAPYKESVAVYGLLNQNDTANYIRVERVFLGEGSALSMAQNPDSVYFKPGDLKVSLQRLRDGIQISVDSPSTSNMEIVLTETFVPTQTGVFSPNQLLYKTTHALYDNNCEYNLVIHNNKSGKTYTCAKPIGLIGDFKSQLTYGGLQQSILTVNPPPPYHIQTVNIVPANGGTVICRFGSPVNSFVCGLILRFYYTEYGSMPISKYIDIPLGTQYVSTTSGGLEVDLSFAGDGVINDIANQISVDPNVNHRTADSVHFIMNAGGFDVGLYNQVNSTTTLSQNKPTYTNINGGVGVFSSRKDYALVKLLTGQCIDRISSDPTTCPLRFYGSGGSISTACP